MGTREKEKPASKNPDLKFLQCRLILNLLGPICLCMNMRERYVDIFYSSIERVAHFA